MKPIHMVLPLSLLASFSHAQISSPTGQLKSLSIHYRFPSGGGTLVDLSGSSDTTVPTTANRTDTTSGAGHTVSTSAITSGAWDAPPSPTYLSLSGTLTANASASESDALNNYEPVSQSLALAVFNLAAPATYTIDITNISIAGPGLLNFVSTQVDSVKTDYQNSTGPIHVSGTLSAGTHFLFAMGIARQISRDNTFNDYVHGDYNIQVHATPEPASMVALAGGVLAMVGKRRRNR